MDDLAERLKSMTPLQRAVYALKETQARLDAIQRRRSEPIAIVGMACRFPGGAVDPESFWRLLCDRVDAVREVPPDRWDVDAFYDPDPAAPGKMCTRWGGFLDGIDLFDNHFFGISDREAARMDPQQRLLMETAWEALEDAGIPPETIRGRRIGVFIGLAQSEYAFMLVNDIEQTDAYVATGTSLCLAANRLSFLYGLHGPSLTLDTACSSSLVALHMACQHIRNGDCEAALVGGANLLLSPIGTINLTKSGFCATDGRVRAFDADATGYVRSEGAGLIVIKPLEDALKNNDPILAVIRSSAVNQNGTSNGLTAPSRAAQEQVLREAYAQAKIAPATVQYVETQGTGTRLGDAIEALALGNVLREGRPADKPCAIGSVKTNLGHMEAASGMASLMKTVLALKHRQLPPSIHFKKPSPDIPFAALPLRVQTELAPWPEPEGHPRLAGVSAFGYGGSNAHIILEEAPAGASESTAKSLDLLPISARTESALGDLVRRYIDFLSNDPPAWSDVCYTASARRTHHDCRLIVAADSAARAVELLKQHLDGQTPEGVFAGRKPYGRDLKTAFVYDDRREPTEGDWQSALPGFSEAASELDAVVQRILGRSLAEVLQDANRIARLAVEQLAMTLWWRRAGVTPDVALGRGAGELAAAFAAGVFTLEQALQLVADGTTPEVKPAVLPLISSVDGRSHLGGDLDAAHWQACLAGRADGWQKALELLDQRKADVRLEMSPSSLRERVLASLYAAGAAVAWRRIAPKGRCVRAPTYPWQRQRLWALKKRWTADAKSEPASQPASQPSIRKRPELTAPYVAPRTEIEKRLCEVWAAVLELDCVGIHDNFFELGGHSLLAAQAASRLIGEFRVELPLRELFGSPTVAQLAERIEAAQQGGHSTQGAIAPIPRQGELPLSLNQEALWFLDRLEPDRPTYMLHLALNVRGPLNLDVLQRALNEIARRHETLRTTFPEIGGRPVQRIAPATTQTLPVVDLSGVPESQREERLRQEIAAEMNRPIDLQNGPLIRITLLRRGPDDYAAVASTHHIIHDGWSMGVLLYELGALYMAYLEGRPSPLRELPIQYVDFAAWQRKLLSGETLERLRNYWRGQLEGVPALELPTDRPRPPIRTTRGSSRPCRLSAETSAAVVEFCRREGATPFMVLLAAFDVLLARHSGQDDFAVGVPVANRNRPETETLIGYFVNVLALRNRLDGDPSFREVVGRVRRTALDGFEHQEMTLDQVVDAVRPPRDLSRNPIFQVMFALQNLKLPPMPEIGLNVAPMDDSPAPPSANFDLTLELFDRDGRFEGGLGYSTDLFDAETIDRMVGEFQTLVAAAVAEPDRKISDLPLLLDSQRQAMLDGWNQTVMDFDRSRWVHQLIEDQAAKNPEAVAVVSDDRRCTYGELNRRANQVACYLQRQGIGPESRVGVCLERSPELFIAVLGVLKAGAAYVPLDMAHLRDAAERLQYVLENSQASLVLTDAAASHALGQLAVPCVLLEDIARDGIDSPHPSPLPEEEGTGVNAKNLAYILYTSGSTGRPKGVMVTHGNLLNAYHGWRVDYELEDRVRSHLQMASFGFDVFGGDMVRALCSGGKLVVCRKEILLDPPQLLDLIEREEIDAAEFVPVVLRNLVQYLEETGLRLERLRLCITGSDAWYAADHRRARDVLGESTRLINSYGLTETTIDSSFFEGEVDALPESGLVPIGRAFGNVRLYVLDDRMQPVPIGVPGQLYIGGEGVARGYVDSSLDAGRFVPDPFSSDPHAKLCKTGDRARRRADGQIEFLGRADNQVKIRGFRVEPAEVEEVLREHPALCDAVVTARQRTAGDVHLAAYVVGQEGYDPDPAELRRYLAERVPDYMVPSVFVPLKALPTTTSGKIDRRGLPEPDWSLAASASSVEYVAPRTPMERRLAAIWSELLSIERVGACDDFFELGGNSLLAIRLVSRIRTECSVDLPLTALFISPKLESLAEQIAEQQQSGGSRPMSAIPRRGHDGPVPLSYPQQRYWKIQQQVGDDPKCNIHAAFEVKGPLDLDAVRQSLAEIVRRHETLRTRFIVDDAGRPMQVVEPDLPMEFAVEDLSGFPAGERRQEVERLSRQQGSQCFDLRRAPLFRTKLLRLGRNEHVILATMHHIISDGWSVQVLFQEMARLYDAFASGYPPPLAPLPIQYADFAQWQQDYFRGETLDPSVDYWRGKLAGCETLSLPTDHPRREHGESSAKKIKFHVSPGVKSALERFGRQENATMYMVLMTAYQALLRRHGGSDDVIVRINTANRERRETQGLIGAFTNRLPLRCDLSGDPTFREALSRVRQATLETFAHQEAPAELLLRRLWPDQDLTHYPGVRVAMSYEQRAQTGLSYRFRGLEFRYLPTDLGQKSTNFDLWLTLEENERGIDGELEYESLLFEESTIQRLVHLFQNMLDEAAANPDQQLSVLAAQCDRQRDKPAADDQNAPEAKKEYGPEDLPLVDEFVASLMTPSMTSGSGQKLLVPLQTGGKSAPLFCIHGLGGHVAAFMPLARELSDGRPIYALQGRGLEPGQTPHDRIEAMAEAYLGEIRDVQPEGPYWLCGWSMGGLIALEAAHRLTDAGQDVALLALFDTHLSMAEFAKLDIDERSIVRWIAPYLNLSLAKLQEMTLDRQWEEIAQQAKLAGGIEAAEIRRLAQVCKAHLDATTNYRPRAYPGRVVLFQADGPRGRLDRRWKSLCPHIHVEPVPGNHYSMLRKPEVSVLAERLGRYLEKKSPLPLGEG